MFCDVIFKSSKVPVGNDSPDTRNKVFLNVNIESQYFLRETSLSYIA
jgi:hypothetical protein